MLTVRLSSKLEARLKKLAKRTGRPKAYYAKKAITEFLDKQEDYLIAIARLEENALGPITGPGQAASPLEPGEGISVPIPKLQPIQVIPFRAIS